MQTSTFPMHFQWRGHDPYLTLYDRYRKNPLYTGCFKKNVHILFSSRKRTVHRSIKFIAPIDAENVGVLFCTN